MPSKRAMKAADRNTTHKDTDKNEAVPENHVTPGAVFSNWPLCPTRTKECKLWCLCPNPRQQMEIPYLPEELRMLKLGELRRPE